VSKEEEDRYMKRLLLLGGLGIGALLLAAVLSSCGSSQSNLSQLKSISGPLPSSLDKYFPPQAQSPVWLIEMFNLSGPFEGIGVSLGEQDMPATKNNFNAFKAQWTKMSIMVPEWTSLFPMQPVTDLGTAINGGDPAKIGQAMTKVGDACTACHIVNQVKAYDKYHWKNFDDVKVTDPVTGQSMKWVDYMTALGGSFDGMTVDLQEGKLANAQKNFQDFNARYTTLGTDGCKQCHVDPTTGKEIPRAYYVDAGSHALVGQLGKALQVTPDPNAIAQLAGAIGNNICLNCHLVHIPAQNTKDQWSTFSNLYK
jgi:hypothetical protein